MIDIIVYIFWVIICFMCICLKYVLCFMWFFFEQDSNVRIPWHMHNESFFSNINSVYITVRSHRLLGPSTTTFFIKIVLLNNIRDQIRLLYKKVSNSQFLIVEIACNYMYVEHVMVHSAKSFYSNCHLYIYHKFKSIFLMVASNTLQTWRKN